MSHDGFRERTRTGRRSAADSIVLHQNVRFCARLMGRGGACVLPTAQTPHSTLAHANDDALDSLKLWRQRRHSVSAAAPGGVEGA
eukprot:gene10934-biopygen6324